MGVAIKPGQNSHKLPVHEHELALRVMAVDQNGNSLEGDNRHGLRLKLGREQSPADTLGINSPSVPYRTNKR